MTEKIKKHGSVEEMAADLKANGFEINKQPHLKLPVKRLINARSALQRLSKKDLSMKAALSMSKLVKAVWTELDNAETLRIKLLESLSDGIDEEKGEYILTDENREKFMEELRELFDTEVILNAEKVNLTDEDIKLSPSDILALEGFVCIKS